MYKQRMQVKPLRVCRNMGPKSGKIGKTGVEDFQFVPVAVVGTVVIMKVDATARFRYTVQAAAGIFVTDINIKFFQEMIVFSRMYRNPRRS